MVRKLLLPLTVAGAVGMALCQWLIYYYAPLEKVMGLAQKIFYVHLPLAWWGLISFFVVFLWSILYLKTKNPAYDRVCAAAAEIGVLLATLTVITGSIWARHSWGVWWTWDPRLTTALILWFVYSGYLILRGLDFSSSRRATLCAVVGVAAFLDVPLVFLSARLWRSIHPAVFASEGGGLDPAMKLTVFACVAAFGCIWLALLLARKGQLDLKARLDSLFMDED